MHCVSHWMRRLSGQSGQVRSMSNVVVVGAGHNGLTAAVLLARQGLSVHVVEQADIIGGACRTEYPFPAAPGLATSTGAYLLGVMPPELLAVLGLDLPLMRRDPHYFLPTTQEGKYLLFGSDQEATRSQFLSKFSSQDWSAYQALQAEIGALRDDIAPALMRSPLSLEQTVHRYVRPHLREVAINLCQRPVAEYLNRFDFRSDLVKAMYAVTDGFSGNVFYPSITPITSHDVVRSARDVPSLTGSWSSPGSGANFLWHNCCRLPSSDGTWMVVKGGMGTVTQQLGLAAQAAGVKIETGRKVESIAVGSDGAAQGVQLEDGTQLRSDVVLVNADPFVLQRLAGHAFSASFNEFVDGMKKDGTTLKVNLALDSLPRFTCLPEPRGQHRTTTHILPDEDIVIQSLTQSFDDVEAGRLPAFPTIEWYFQTTVDDSMQDEHGRHNSALFVQWVPHDISGSSWDVEEAPYVEHLLGLCDTFAPGTSNSVVDYFALTPPKIEQHFGISRGHIHCVDNGFSFLARMPYATPVPGLYSASAGTHPAGSVMGCAGHNSAWQIISDLGLDPYWQDRM